MDPLGVAYRHTQISRISSPSHAENLAFAFSQLRAADGRSHISRGALAQLVQLLCNGLPERVGRLCQVSARLGVAN